MSRAPGSFKKGLIGMVAAIGVLACAPLAPAATYHVAPAGSDSNPGTQERPWRTLDKALGALVPGDTAYLHEGTYGARGTVTRAELSGTSSAAITISGYPGEAKPAILGHFKITGNHLRFSGLLFDGPTGEVKPITDDNPKGEQVQVAINGDHVTLADSIVRESWWRAGVFLSDAENVRIVDNCIENNGDRDPELWSLHWNWDHGVYFGSGSGVVARNTLASNVARGIQLYRHPHDVTIADNTIVYNGRAGIQIAAETMDSMAERNLVAYNGDTGIRSHALSGTGNVARDNYGYQNEHGDFGDSEPGLSFSGNATLDSAPALGDALELCGAPPLDDQPPTSPTGLEANAKSSTSVALSWVASSDDVGVDHYTVYRDGERIGSSTSPDYVDDTVSPGTTYSYAVDAIDAAGNASALSTPASATTPALASTGIVFRDASSAANATSKTLTLAIPDQVIAGDAMVAAVDVRGKTKITPPGGWKLIRSDRNDPAMRQAVYYREAGNSEPSSYSWAFSASRAAAGGIAAYDGVASVSPVDTHGGQANGRSTSITAPSVSTTTASTRLIGVFGIARDTGIAPPTDMAERAEATSTGTYDVTAEIADVHRASAGVTGMRSAKSLGPGKNVGALVALRAG